MAGGAGEALVRRRVGLGIGAAVAVLALGLGACGASDGGSGSSDGSPTTPTTADGRTERPEPVGEPIDLSTPGLHELTPPPMTERGPYGESIEVVLDGEVAVWGGFSAESDSGAGTIRNDGALLSLDDGRWTAMPAAPFELGLYQPVGAWDGEELIVIGTECTSSIPPNTEGGPPDRCPSEAAAAAFDPEAFSWRRLDPPPIPLDETSGVPTVGYWAAAVGGEGSAVFAFGRHGTAVAWDGATSSWTSIEGPAPEVQRVELCADSIAGQVVAVIPRQLADGQWATRLSLLELGADAWRDTVDLDLPTDQAISCGDGHVAFSGFDFGTPDPESAGAVVDVETGATTEAFAPTADIRSAWITGPWLFDRGTTPMGAPEGDRPEPARVRLLRSPDPTPVGSADDRLEGWPWSHEEDQYLPGIGVITAVVAGFDPAGAIWVAPPELQPS